MDDKTLSSAVNNMIITDEPWRQCNYGIESSLRRVEVLIDTTTDVVSKLKTIRDENLRLNIDLDASRAESVLATRQSDASSEVLQRTFENRLISLQQQNAKLQTAEKVASEDLKAVRVSLKEMGQRVYELERQNTVLSALQDSKNDWCEKSKHDTAEQQAILDDMKADILDYKERVTKFILDNQEKRTAMQREHSAVELRLKDYEAALTYEKNESNTRRERITHLQDDINRKKQTIMSLESQLAFAEATIKEELPKRKKMEQKLESDGNFLESVSTMLNQAIKKTATKSETIRRLRVIANRTEVETSAKEQQHGTDDMEVETSAKEQQYGTDDIEMETSAKEQQYGTDDIEVETSAKEEQYGTDDIEVETSAKEQQYGTDDIEVETFAKEQQYGNDNIEVTMETSMEVQVQQQLEQSDKDTNMVKEQEQAVARCEE